MGKKNQITTSDHFTYSEFQRFLTCLRNDKNYRWEMYARLSFATACRVGDVLNIRWKDILGVSSITVVEQKTKKVRRIPFNPTVQKSFYDLWKLMGCPDKNDYVMQRKGATEHITCNAINQMLKLFKYRYNLDIDHFSSHTFRKTFGRYVYDTNEHSAESLMLLNKIFNHSSIQITKRYIGITQEEIDGVYASIMF